MHYSLLIAAALFAGIVALGVMLDRKNKPVSSSTYSRRDTLLTPTELVFREALQKALPAGTWVNVQVNLRALLNVDPRGKKSQHRVATNKIHGKYLDFVVCDELSSRILCAIELNDSTHLRADRRTRDKFLRQAFDEAGIPLLQIKTASSYDQAELRGQLKAAGI